MLASTTPVRLVPGLPVLVLLAACSPGESHAAPPRSAPLERTGETVRLLDLTPVEEAGPHEPSPFARRLAGDELWVVGEEVAPDRWAPAPGGDGLERTRLLATTAPGALVQTDQEELTREGWRSAPGADPAPAPGQLMVRENWLWRPRGARHDWPLRVTYPADRGRLAELVSVRDRDGRPRPRELRLGVDCRRAAAVEMGTDLIHQLELPEAARLDLGFAARLVEARVVGEGVQLRRARAGRPVVRVVLELEDGTRAVLLEEELGRKLRDRYQDRQLDLSPWSGRLVRLRLECEPAPDLVDGWTGFLAWAEPIVWSARPDPRPDVIVLLLDTLRADRLGCHGWERARTPHLDGLAARGVRFDQAMSASSWTLPSHASLFTSSYPSQHGLWSDQRLPEALTTLAEVMDANGYRTAAFTERGFVKEDHGFARGFERFDSAMREPGATFERAAEWIEARRSPYFVFVHTYKVHSPYDPEEPFRSELVRPYDGELPRDIDVRAHPWGRGGPQPPEADRDYVSDLYDAEVAELDHAIGAFLERLEAAGRLEDTLLLVTSDHGEEFFEHGHTLHGLSLYQEQLHVPLILSWPGHFEGGRVVEHPVHLVDVAPTVLDAAGIDAPEAWVGVPLGLEPPGTERPLFSSMLTYWAGPRHRGDQAMALREGDLVYVDYPEGHRDHDPVSGPALFDVARDPLQQEDLLDGRTAGAWAENAVRVLESFPRVGRAGAVEQDEATLSELRRLGYVGDE